MGAWGDGAEVSPRDAAAGHPEILALLEAPARPDYVRRSDPPLPAGLTADQAATDRQGEIGDRSGLLFQAAVLKADEER